MKEAEIWFRCKCGKAFSNQEEIDEPTVSDLPHGKTVRYYFGGGTVIYPPGGGTHKATCWECSEG